MMNLALFDLDHTLLPIDSDYSWGTFTTTIGWTDPVAFARRNDEFYAHYQAGTLDVHDYVRFATEAVRLRGPEAAAAALQAQGQPDVPRLLSDLRLAVWAVTRAIGGDACGQRCERMIADCLADDEHQ